VMGNNHFSEKCVSYLKQKSLGKSKASIQRPKPERARTIYRQLVYTATLPKGD